MDQREPKYHGYGKCGHGVNVSLFCWLKDLSPNGFDIHVGNWECAKCKQKIQSGEYKETKHGVAFGKNAKGAKDGVKKEPKDQRGQSTSRDQAKKTFEDPEESQQFESVKAIEESFKIAVTAIKDHFDLPMTDFLLVLEDFPNTVKSALEDTIQQVKEKILQKTLAVEEEESVPVTIEHTDEEQLIPVNGEHDTLQVGYEEIEYLDGNDYDETDVHANFDQILGKIAETADETLEDIVAEIAMDDTSLEIPVEIEKK